MARSKLEIAISVERVAWTKKWPSFKRDIAGLLKSAGTRRDLSAPTEGVVSIVLTGDTDLRRLNRQFRGKDRPTNVLSFPDEVEPLGGIAIAYETVFREAREQNKDFVNHAKHMILHGFLHLLGHDHVVQKDARLMEQIEIAILRDLGIPNPYLIEKPSA
jgi:probable rRNA maturation factor